MATTIGTQTGAPRLWLLRTVTLIAFIISLLASLNLYLLEDGNPLTQGAYLASPLLRFSYDGVYLSALAAGVLLRWLGPVSLRAPLLTLLAGVAAALLATWLTRIATWPAEPPLRRPDDMLPDAPAEPRGHDVMTTGEATAMLQTRGRLVAP